MQKNMKAAPTKVPSKMPAKVPAKVQGTPVTNVEERVDEERVDDEGEDEETAEIASVDNEELVSKDEEEDMDALLGMSVPPTLCT